MNRIIGSNIELDERFTFQNYQHNTFQQTFAQTYVTHITRYVSLSVLVSPAPRPSPILTSPPLPLLHNLDIDCSTNAIVVLTSLKYAKSSFWCSIKGPFTTQASLVNRNQIYTEWVRVGTYKSYKTTRCMSKIASHCRTERLHFCSSSSSCLQICWTHIFVPIAKWFRTWSWWKNCPSKIVGFTWQSETKTDRLLENFCIHEQNMADNRNTELSAMAELHAISLLLLLLQLIKSGLD